MTESSCAFCEELATGQLRDTLLASFGAPSFARVVLTSPHGIVVPSLGPLTADHCLVVSQRHAAGLRDVGPREREGLLEFAKDVGHRLALTSGGRWLVFENDTAAQEAAPDCVRHVHIHVLTIPQPAAEALLARAIRDAEESSELVVESPWEAIARRPDAAYSYWAAAGSVPAARIGGVPRQWMRRVVAEVLGLRHWNWRDDPQVSGVRRMVDELSVWLATDGAS